MRLRKNVLDLQFQKHLQYTSTAIIVAFTYIVGLAIAFLTGQVKFQSEVYLLLSMLLSAVVLITAAIVIFHSTRKMKTISAEILSLRNSPSATSRLQKHF